LNAETAGSCAGLKRYLYSFGAMARPMFIVGIVPLYALGATAAWADVRSIDIPRLIAGLVAVWLVQLMTHYNNEYCDLETDRATAVPTLISGGSGCWSESWSAAPSARTASLVCLALAVVLAFILVFVLGAGVWAFAFIAAAAFLGWNYSGRPLKLESAGLGEATLILIACFLLPRPATISSRHGPPRLSGDRYSGRSADSGPDIDHGNTGPGGGRGDGQEDPGGQAGERQRLQLMMASLAAGWAAFVLVIVSLWPFRAGGGRGQPAADGDNLGLAEIGPQRGPRDWRTGLAISLLVGYASICLALSFVF